MTYDELMIECKAIFNFAHDERFQNVSHILEVARKEFGSKHFYILGAAMLAERVALYLDQNEAIK